MALRNASPLIEVKPRRVGGATYQVPVEIDADRRMSLGMRWVIESARKRPGKSSAEKLADELIDASRNLGNAVQATKRRTRWPRPIRPLLITAGSIRSCRDLIQQETLPRLVLRG